MSQCVFHKVLGISVPSTIFQSLQVIYLQHQPFLITRQLQVFTNTSVGKLQYYRAAKFIARI